MSKNLKIIYVDDDPQDRLRFKEILAEINGNHELQLLSSHDSLIENILEDNLPPPDLFIIDVSLPKVSPGECISAIKKVQKFRKSNIAILSSNTAAEATKSAYDAGADWYVIKNNDDVNLKELIAKTIDTCLNYQIQNRTLINFVIK